MRRFSCHQSHSTYCIRLHYAQRVLCDSHSAAHCDLPVSSPLRSNSFPRTSLPIKVIKILVSISSSILPSNTPTLRGVRS